MQKNFLKLVIIFLISFVFYFSLCLIFSYYLNTISSYNIFWGSDSPRVFADLIMQAGNHARVIVHPLFVIMFQPVVAMINIVIPNEIEACLFLQSIIGGLSVVIFYLIINKFKIDEGIKYVFLLVFSVSFSQLIFSSTLETYIFAEFFLLTTLYFAQEKLLKKPDIANFIILLLLGIFCLGITITNVFMYGIIVTIFLFINKSIEYSINKKIKYIIMLVVCVSSTSIWLSEIQYVLFPGSKLFFVENFKSLIIGNSIVKGYITPFSFSSFKNVIDLIFGNAFISNNIIFINDVNYNKNMVLLFSEKNIYGLIITIVFFLLFVVGNLAFTIKNFKQLFNHPLYIACILCLIYNILLHSIYGNDELFLYSCHYVFLIVIICAYLWQYLTNKIWNVFLAIFLLIEVFCNTNNLINIYKSILNHYGTMGIVSLKFLALFVLIFILIILLLLRDRKNDRDLLLDRPSIK